MDGTVENFEDLKIWQEARCLIREIYSCTSIVKDYGFNDQIQRAAISIMNNIAEGFEAGSPVMFRKFLNIAKGSCGEVRSMLYIALDLKYFDEKGVDKLLFDCKYLSAAIHKLIVYLNQK